MVPTLRLRVFSRAFVPALAACAALVSGSSSATAAGPVSTIRERPIVDNAVTRATRTGIASVHTMIRTRDAAPVVIELNAPATDAMVVAIEAAGAVVERADGRVIKYDRFIPAHIDQATAVRLAALPFVAHVSLAPTSRILPLDQSAEITRLLDARGARQDLDDLTGTGITVGDVDSLVDVFHPTFFRGDGGYVAWIDVDADGVFTPGTDAIDLDGDGKASAGETAVALSAATVDYGKPISARKGGWNPGYDWVYLDTNGNKKRDFGPAGGFTDMTPAFGEPLFVPDDLDRSGKIEVGEKFVRLQTSKFKAIRLNVTYLANVKQVFTRGTNLTKTPTDLTADKLYGFPDALHATGVTSIIAGDVPLMGRKWVGMAPDVDLALSFDVDSDGNVLPTTGATWAISEGANVMLYEMAPWTGLPLDGSDALSAIIDSSATKSNVAHTCPTGDQGSARKHARATLAANAVSDLTFNVPATTKAGVGPLTYVAMTAHVRGGDIASMALVDADGTSIPLSNNAMGKLASGALYYATIDTTSRGTVMYDVILYAQDATMPFTVGDYKIHLAAGAAPVTVDAYVSDDKSSWAVGAAWDESVSSDVATIGVPSTADHCIAVGAMPDHLGSEASWFAIDFYSEYDVPPGTVEKAGQVRAYSPRGPRIDGVLKPDILGPDNPFAAYPYSAGVMYTGPHGSYAVFGGTSGASPHVTGIAAILAQVGIKGDAARDAIRKGALTDSTMGTLPNGDYGYGRLNAGGALGLTKVGDVPTVTIVASKTLAQLNEKVTLTAQPMGGDTFQAKWDDNYDGTWDVPYATLAPREVTNATAATIAYKVHVRNAGGRVAEAVTYVTYSPTAPSSSSTSSSGCGCRASNDASSMGGTLLLGGLALAATRRRKRA